MTKILSVLALAVLVLTGAAAPAAAHSPFEEGLPTLLTLLTGYPEPGAEPADGVLLMPGPVIPVESGIDTLEELSVESALAQNEVITRVADQLQGTLRLAAVEVQYRSDRNLQPDVEVELPPATPDSSVVPRVTLLRYDHEGATYRVVITDGDRTLAHSSVTVPFGRRTIVGALNGQEAPYLFLVVEAPPAQEGGSLAMERLTPPRALEKVAPSYTEDARKIRIQGVVIVQTVIDKHGSVARVRILKGLHPSLDKAALEAIRQWRFEPALLEGEPVAVHYNLTINYRLDDSEKEESS